MRFQRSFTVPARQRAVLDALTNVERIAACLPGGLVDGRARGSRFGGQFALQLGSATAPYSAIIAISERDDDAGRAVVTVQGNDDQGDGTADATATFAVAPAASGSEVQVLVEVVLGGRLAQVPDGDAVAEGYTRNAVAKLRAGILSDSAAPAAPEPPTAGAATSKETPAEPAPAFGHAPPDEVGPSAREEAPAEKSPRFGAAAPQEADAIGARDVPPLADRPAPEPPAAAEAGLPAPPPPAAAAAPRPPPPPPPRRPTERAPPPVRRRADARPGRRVAGRASAARACATSRA